MKHIYEVFHAGPADFGRFHVVAENRQQAKARVQAAEAELAAALRDTDAYVRREAATALGKLGAAAAPHAAQLAAALWDFDAEVRKSAAEALGKLGAAAAELAAVRLEAANS